MGHIGTEKQQVHVHLCEILNDTPVNQVLSTVPQARWEDLCQEYLYDYLLTVHHVTHHEAQQEYEVINVIIIICLVIGITYFIICYGVAFLKLSKFQNYNNYVIIASSNNVMIVINVITVSCDTKWQKLYPP